VIRAKALVGTVGTCGAAALLVALAVTGNSHGPAGAAAATGSQAGLVLAQSPPPQPTRSPVSLPDLVQVDILADRAVAVRVKGAMGSVARISLVYKKDSAGLLPAGSQRVRLRQSAQTVEVAIGAGVRQAVSTCSGGRFVAHVALRTGRDTVRRQASGHLFLAPPRCGQFFSARSIWNTPLPDDMPLAGTSRAVVSELSRQLKIDGATINISRYSTPIYTVPADQPRVRFVIDTDSTIAADVKAQFVGGVPIPPSARASGGTDGQLTVWQPATDTLWEFRRARRIDGTWHATWGALMRNVSRNNGSFPRQPSGAFISTTGSGLPLIGGLITLSDLRRAQIDHALQIAIPEARRGVWSHPADISDGVAEGPDTIPEGARFRLPAKLDIDALGLPPLTAMLAKAAQRYGIIVVDQSGSVSFRGQDPLGGHEWLRALRGEKPYQILGRFPWGRLQLTEMVLSGANIPRNYTRSPGKTTSASPKQQRPPLCYLYGLPESVFPRCTGT
jgi:hypothetical protein